MKNDNINRIYNLDILKILAAVGIVCHHYQQLSGVYFTKGINFYGGVFSFGSLVELFFIISGVLMAMTVKPSETINIVKQIKKRLIRILPMTALSVIVMYIIYLIYKSLFHSALYSWDYNIYQLFSSLLLVNQGWIVEFFPGVNNPIWYLCVLMLLTIIYLLVAKICKNENRLIIVSSIIIIIGLFGYYFQIDKPFLHNSSCRGYVSFFGGG